MDENKKWEPTNEEFELVEGLFRAAERDKWEKIARDAELSAAEEYWEAHPDDPDNPFS